MSRIIAALAAHAICTPTRPAVCGSELCMGWRALSDEVSQLARRLDQTRVLGLLMENSPAWIAVDLAALQAGCTHIPLPGFFADRQLQFAVHDAGVDTLITDDPARLQRLFPAAALEELEIGGRACARLTLQRRQGAAFAGTARITYTSGTTGTPKGVCLSAHALEAVAGSLLDAAHAGPDDRALVLLPLAILLENIGSVYTPVLAGAQIIVPAPQESGISGSSSIDSARLAAMLWLRQPTSLIVPPALLKLLVQLGRAGQLPSSLRFIAVGGAPVGSALLREAAELGLPVYQGYGLSEAGSVVAVNTPGNNRPGSVGKPLPHSRVRIGSNGEIRIRGITFSGYVNGPGHAANTDLCTGDCGYLDEDGYLYVTGRINDRIITAFGRNVAPEWVESELQAHPDIMQAAVLGNGLPRLAAVLVALPGVSHQRLEAAVDAVNLRLPDYARVASWTLADEPFSAGNGTQSPVGTLRRAVVAQDYVQRLAVNMEACHE